MVDPPQPDTIRFSPDPSPELPQGTILGGRYRLDEAMARGGMGVVWRGFDLHLDREVAVKLVRPELLDAEARERLLREARAAAALNHPNIVSVHDAGEDSGRPYVVMELVRGGPLRAAMPGSFEEIVRTAEEICAALEHAHAQGVVHRDLKPENLLLAGGRDSRRLKLVDLGLAIPRGGTRVTQAGFLAGTVAYMAPEQALGRDLDARTDLYALGVMLYEMIAQRLPFPGDDPIAVLSQHVHAPVVPPRAYRADVPPGLERIVLRLLEKEPERRYASASEVARALHEVSLAPGAAPEETTAAVALLEELARGRLVGRASELAELRDLWSRARAGRGHLVLVSGEPGAGKTRLARELLVTAQIDGAKVLHGGCYEYEAATPYLPFVEAIRRWSRAAGDAELRARMGDAAPQVARLVPELERRLGPFPSRHELPPHEERLLLFDGVARFFAALGADRGAVVYIDDLHWSDTGTLALLSYLLRQLRGEPILFAASYRETELDRTHPLANSLLEWNRERLSTRIALGRMDRPGTAALLATLLGEDGVSEEFAEAVHAETEGNPFFVEEVLKTLIEEGKVYRERGSWQRCEVADLAIPQGVKATIGHRLDRVGGPCNDVLRVAAVLGKVFSFHELTVAAGGKSEDEILDALDEATAAQLILPGSGETFAFTHDKIREVLYEELNPIRRRRLHLRAAEGLEQTSKAGSAVEVEDLAHHFIEAGEYGRGLHYAREAAAQAARIYAYQEAIHLYDRARECADALGEIETAAEIEETLGNVLLTQGSMIAAGEHFRRALDATTDPARRIRVQCRLGFSLVARGDEAGLPLVEAALAELDPLDQPEDTARALTIQARFHHLKGQHRRAVDIFLRALEILGPDRDPVTLTEIYGFLAGAHQHLAQFEQSDAWARRAIALGVEQNLPLAEALGYEFLSENAVTKGTWAEGVADADYEREIARRLGSREREAWTHLARGLNVIMLGRHEEGLQELVEGRAIATRIGEVRLDSLLNTFSVLPLVGLGRLPEAESVAFASLDQAEATGLLYMRAEARRLLALVHLRKGEYEESLRRIAEIDALLAGTDACVPAIHAEPRRCEALVALGRIEEAAASAGRMARLAESSESALAREYARECAERVAAARG